MLGTVERREGVIVGNSTALRTALQQAAKAARCAFPILIQGETGTGKELLARSIHDQSARAGGAFVRVNCAALPESLLEDELFGHERGAYTGAERSRAGRFERARGGTLFLDEVGELSASAQAKLLRVLESGEFERLGGQDALSSDARILAATNRDLVAECEAGRFRWDLYYRLNVLTLTLPALRERGDDLLLLAEHILAEQGSLSLADDAKVTLLAHPWPGNVRELRNVLLRASTYAAGQRLSASDLDLAPSAPTERASATLAGRRLADVEREAILQTLALATNKEDAARLLGVTSRTLRNKLARYRAEGRL